METEHPKDQTTRVKVRARPDLIRRWQKRIKMLFAPKWVRDYEKFNKR